MKRVLLITALVVGVALWLLYPRPYDWSLAKGMPTPDVPVNNPMSSVKVELGRWLFYDTRLSINGAFSCGSCHVQALAFTDGRRRAVGATGEVHPRSAMSLVNSAYASRLTWANSLTASLEDQALTPLFGDDPIEMGLGGREDALAELFTNDQRYADLFREAFPRQERPGTVINMVRAISSFTRSIVSFRSPYDAWLAGDATAISESAQRGEALFFSERLECFHCHGGFNFTDSTTHKDARVERFGYHNTGLYNLGNTGAYPADNPGLIDITGKRRDMGKFRAPTLRNIAVTAPYMHDGSIATLEDVIEHYARGGRLIEEGPNAGDGNVNPFKSEFVRGFELTEAEKRDLLAFLESLTDEAALSDPRWSSPWTEATAAGQPPESAEPQQR
ncbi:MAG: di-heme enzyme [Woeseiaceae bacterium]|nr:di-heme enzyme [Woeseiaceae bacterium]